MENHTTTTTDNMLQALLQLNGYTYYYRSDEYPEYQLPNTPQIGLMAQEVEQVFPQLVVTNQVGHKAVNYMGLIPVLVEAVKQQHALVQQQSAQIERLEKAILALEQKNKKFTNAGNKIPTGVTSKQRNKLNTSFNSF